MKPLLAGLLFAVTAHAGLTAPALKQTRARPVAKMVWIQGETINVIHGVIVSREVSCCLSVDSAGIVCRTDDHTASFRGMPWANVLRILDNGDWTIFSFDFPAARPLFKP